MRRREQDYTRETLTSGDLHLESVPGFHVDVTGIFELPLPDEYDLLEALLAERSSSG